MTPIEKNIIVVDEQGNEYEATYPKRAKGLCKNGRARFIDENTICLACPPKDKTEDNKMSENINAEAKTLTAKDIFDRISELQRQITENSNYSLHRLGDCFSDIYNGEEAIERDKQKEIAEVCRVFTEREKTLVKMLEIYERMYDDLCPSNSITKSIELIKKSVETELELIRSSEMPSSRKHLMQIAAIDKGRTRMNDVILRSQQNTPDETANMPQSNNQ